MLLSIEHVTELNYSERVSETVMEVRVTPRTDRHQTLRGSRIEVGPHAPLLEYDDWLGNRVHQFSVMPFHDRVKVVAHAGVITHRADGDLGAAQDLIGVDLDDPRHLDFLLFRGPIVVDDRLEALSTRLGLDGVERVAQAALNVSTGLRDHLRYEKGVTTSSTPVPEVLDHGGGVCQDLAHVAIALLRRAGVRTRYVSGYLHREDAPELETHAWCEVYLPSAGWVPIDPTHRSGAGPGHIVVAIGRDFSDVAPNKGVYRGDAEQKTTARVKIQAVDELPEGLLAPRAPSFEVPSYSEGPQVHREQLDYQQEQQQQ